MICTKVIGAAQSCGSLRLNESKSERERKEAIRFRQLGDVKDSQAQKTTGAEKSER